MKVVLNDIQMLANFYKSLQVTQYISGVKEASSDDTLECTALPGSGITSITIKKNQPTHKFNFDQQMALKINKYSHTTPSREFHPAEVG